MKNALIITTIGGFVPQFEMNDVKILQEYGYTIHYASDFENPVYSIDYEELEKEGLILHHIDIKKSPFKVRENTKAFFQLKKIIEEENITLVHCHNPMGGVVGRLAACCCKRSPYTIYTAHGFHFYQGAPIKNWVLYYTAERLLARYTNRLIVINGEDYERAKKFRLYKNGKIEIIPGVGIDVIKFCKKKELREIKRNDLKISKEAFHVVSVGELNDNKNHAAIIQAIAELEDTDIYYSICGRGIGEEKLRDLINEYHLESRVRLLGYRTDVDEVLQSADCFAFPSKREGLGIAAVEALACEVPVIAADNRGTREYMRQGEDGIVCHTQRVDEYACAIMELKNSPKLRETMSKNGRKMAENFGIDETDKIMRRIYGEISKAQESM